MNLLHLVTSEPGLLLSLIALSFNLCRCRCGFGYKAVGGPSAAEGTYCVARCNARSCRNGAVCSEASDESSEVKCACSSGYTGDRCESQSGQLPLWSIILIGVLAGIAAIVGLALLIFACCRLLPKREAEDDNSDSGSSINNFKPKGIPFGEYDRMTDLGSVSKANRGFAGIIDEGFERARPSAMNDGQNFGNTLMSSRLSVPSEHGDPTPVLDPYTRTDRHSVSDVVSRPDYY